MSDYKFISTFREIPLEERQGKVQALKVQFPDKVPIIIDYDSASTMKHTKHKYLMNKTSIVAYLIENIIDQHSTLNVVTMCDLYTETGVIVQYGDLIEKLYSEYKNEDGFLYLIIKKRAQTCIIS